MCFTHETCDINHKKYLCILPSFTNHKDKVCNMMYSFAEGQIFNLSNIWQTDVVLKIMLRDDILSC